MQLRMSPGGSTRYSRRRRPELPPSSVTVTIAARSLIGWRSDSCRRRATYCFSPRSSIESPVPPPIATTRTPPGPAVRSRVPFFIGIASLWSELAAQLDSGAGGFAFGVEQFGKAGIFLQEREIFVVARVVAVFRTQLNRDFQIFHRRFGFPGQTIQRGHCIENVIGLGRKLA